MKSIRGPNAALLIDGTALYFRSRGRSEGDRLDYEALSREFRTKASVTSFDPALFYTAFDSHNEGQTKFLAFLQGRLQWRVETRPVWAADPLPQDAPRVERRNEFIRFDSSIAFALGRLVDQRGKIIVVTDSFALEQPMLTAAEYGKAEIVLAFFGGQLDSRWLTTLQGADKKITFWDLDNSSEPLFPRESTPTKRSAVTLAHILN